MKKHNLLHYIVTVIYQLLMGALLTLIGVAIVIAGYTAYKNQASPLNLIISIPLVLGGAGLTINFLWTIILTIFSPTYNRGVCKICE